MTARVVATLLTMTAFSPVITNEHGILRRERLAREALKTMEVPSGNSWCEAERSA